MILNGISGTDYSSIIAQTQTNGLEGTLGSFDKTKATDDEMMNACKEFEAYMIEQVYKSMEKTIIKADEDENEYETYFGDMRIQKYAQSVDITGIWGYNVSVILDKYALAATRVLL